MSAPAPPAAHTHDHASHAEQLAFAERRATEAGESLTPLRRRVFELLLDAGGPAKAYDLLEGLRSEAGAAKPPTIYRALDFLTKLGLAHRVESLNAFIACGLGGCARSTIFLICRGCGRTEEADAGHATHDVEEAATRAGFRVERTLIETHGLCAACAETRP